MLKKRLPIIVLLTLLGAGSAYVFSKRQQRIYKATTTLSINASAPSSLIPYIANALSSNGGSTPVEQLANTYNVFLTSRSFDTDVVKALRLPVTPEALATHISSALIPGTNYYQINVTWNNAQQAANIANNIASVFIRRNNAAQAQNNSNNQSADVTQSLAYFRTAVSRLQRQYLQEVNSRHPRQSVIAQTQDRLTNLLDTYYRIQGTAGANAQPATTGANSASVSDAAVAPHFPISPKVTTNVLSGLFAGLLLGLGLAFLLEFLDNSFHTPEDVEYTLGQAPLGLVGLIGVDSPGGRRRRGFPGLFGGRGGRPAAAGAKAGPVPLAVVNPQFVTLNHPKAAITEAFRTMRTNLDFSSLDRNLKSLVVTSSVPAEGKSTVSANLAIAEAQAGKRVILVDADLRRPSMGRIFGLKKDVGLTTVLLNKENRARAIEEALQPTVVPNLYVMTSRPHPPNPAELLASQATADVIRELESRADLVIFDTPPMGALTDAVVLAARVDSTILVTRAGSTRRNVVTNSINTIKKVGGTVTGTVLNMVNLKEISSYSYYYYYSSEYYYGRDEATTVAGARS